MPKVILKNARVCMTQNKDPKPNRIGYTIPNLIKEILTKLVVWAQQGVAFGKLWFELTHLHC